MSEQKYYIGQIFDDMYPSDAADWCNNNDAIIVEIEPENEVRRFRIDAIPEPTVDVKKQAVRAVRDAYINDIEWRVSRYRDQKEIQVPTTDDEETYTKILQYMQYLRDYPESGGTWYEQNPLDFESWEKNYNEN